MNAVGWRAGAFNPGQVPVAPAHSPFRALSLCSHFFVMGQPHPLAACRFDGAETR